MNKSNIGLRNLTVPIVVIMLIMFSLSSVFVDAQSTYQTIVKDVSIPESGIVTVDVPEADISYEITGAPGATGTVTTEIKNENPNPTASIPTGIGLTLSLIHISEPTRQATNTLDSENIINIITAIGTVKFRRPMLDLFTLIYIH